MTRTPMSFSALLLLGTSINAWVPQPAVAEAGPAKAVYQAAYFAKFAPSTALQMIERVPGFTLEIGDQDVRGFGQAAGNVVINGQRPSSKSDTLDTILARIPASRVVRIEVGPGEQFGSEFTGKPQIANLVLTDAGGIAGTLEVQARRSFTGKYYPQGSASALLRTGKSTFNASANFYNNQTTEEGTDTLTALPSGTPIEFRRKVNTIDDPNGDLSASWAYDDGPNKTAHLNGRFALDRFALTQNNAVFPASGANRNDMLTQRYRQREFEIGGDLTRPLFGGAIKLLGLATRRHRVNSDLSANRVGSVVIGGFAQTLEDQRDETVGRLVWNKADVLGWSLELGAEAALNRLDSQVNLFSIDGTGAQTRVDLPVDQALVTEYRGEAFINAGRVIGKGLRLDLGLVYEKSHLTVTGDANARRTLSFLKPKVSLDWRPDGGWHVQLSVARTVAQLEFEDFIGAAELSNDRINGGNTDLLPQRAWESRLTVEHPILGDGRVRFELGYDRIALVQDRVPTPEGFDAPGNLGKGVLLKVQSTLDIPLAKLGIKGGRLTARGTIDKTSVLDPYTRQFRAFSYYSLASFDIGFRQDLKSFAWGVSLSGNSPSTAFRQNEIDTAGRDTPYVKAFVEYRPSPRTTLTLGLDNATGIAAYRQRTFFDPDRTTTTPSAFELRERNRHIVPYLTLKHSFGA